MRDLTPLTPPTSQLNPAQSTYEKLVRSIIEFEEKLTDDEEIGGRIVGAPGPGLLPYRGPRLSRASYHHLLRD